MPRRMIRRVDRGRRLRPFPHPAGRLCSAVTPADWGKSRTRRLRELLPLLGG